jgi:hypothetical protein
MKELFTCTEQAVETFIESATQHSTASENGDYKTANRHYALVQKAVRYFRETSQIKELEKLLDHPDVRVRLAAAAYSLGHYKQKAITVLEDIVAQRIPHKSFEAELILNEYRKGNFEI